MPKNWWTAVVLVLAFCLTVQLPKAPSARAATAAAKILTTSELQAGLKARCADSIGSGYDWPASPTNLYKISGGIVTATLKIPGKVDVSAQRAHGWSLFAGVTAPSGGAESLPVFHTWYTVEEAFDPSAGKLSCSKRRPAFRISLPTQLVMEMNAPLTSELRSKGLQPSPRFDVNPAVLSSPTAALATDEHAEPIAFSHVAFNTEMYNFLRDNKFYSKSALNSMIDPNVARKAIADPPLKGVSLKLAWWPAAPDKLTPVPVWDFDPRFGGDAKNPPTTWKRIVMVDPVGGLPAPATVKFGGFDHAAPKTVALNSFYAIQVSAPEAAAANADFRIQNAAKSVLGRDLQEGDYLLLTAMHIATREYDPWVWLTYWWTDKPGAGPLAGDMPNLVQGVWRNYVMDVSYNINNPQTSTGAAPIAYNPWLELFQKGGTRSQCMACHARAAFGQGVSAGFNPTNMATADKNGFEGTPIDANDPAFQKGTLSLHRVWTILTRAN